MNTTSSQSNSGAPTSAFGRRMKYGVNVTVLLVAVLFILVMVNWFTSGSTARFDLTAGRAYSLSPQTRAIIDSLNEPVTLSLLFTEADPNLTEAERASVQSARSQVQDVLEEFQRRSDKIKVLRIDPTDPSPSTIAKYDELIKNIRSSKKDLIAQYESVIAEAKKKNEALNDFLRSEVTMEADQLALLDQSHQLWRQFRQINQVMATMPVTLNLLVRQADASLQAGSRRPLPDWEAARSTLVQVFQQPASTFEQVVSICRDAEKDDSLPAAFKAGLEPMAKRFDAMADDLTAMRDTLRDLKPINLSLIIRQITTGNCVLLSDETDTNVIPFNSLFPMPSARQIQQQQAIDRRFAGERVISSAIRRLTIKNPSTVVICHAEKGDILRPSRQGGPSAKIAAVAQQIRDLGFDVKAWNVTTGKKPEVKGNEFGEPVWVILPPQPNMGGPQGSEGAAKLADVATELVSSGARVMMNYWPSPMVGFGQPDFWNKVVEPLGVKADTGKQVFQNLPAPNGQSQNVTFFDINEFKTDQAIGEAVNGLDTVFVSAVPLILKGESGFEDQPDENDADITSDKPADDADAGVKDKSDDDTKSDASNNDEEESSSDAITRTVIADLQPTNLIWAEENWMGDPKSMKPPSEVQKGPIHLAVAVERGMKSGVQRCLIMSSAFWFDDQVVQQQTLIDGALLYLYPGNAELFTSGVCWLAGDDELIAPSAMTQTISRIAGLSHGAVTAYRILFMAVLPLICLGFGVGVWIVRRG